MSLRVAITRPIGEAHTTADRVRTYGAEPVITPLLELEARSFDPDVDGAQALLFTSGNGVAAFAAASTRRDIAVLTVGDATADAAGASGFTQIVSADGDARALIDIAARTLAPSAGKLLHFSGEHIAVDLVGALAARGFAAERRVAYAMRMAATLPDAFTQKLDIVLFYSARAAQAFRALGAPGAEGMTAACLSQGVADAVGSVWGRILVSPAPREDALLVALFASGHSPAGATA